jgi:hypothetical protein
VVYCGGLESQIPALKRFALLRTIPTGSARFRPKAAEKCQWIVTEKPPEKSRGESGENGNVNAIKARVARRPRFRRGAILVACLRRNPSRLRSRGEVFTIFLSSEQEPVSAPTADRSDIQEVPVKGWLV